MIPSLSTTLSESKDWHRAGKDNSLLCSKCLYFKNYGDDLALDPDGQLPPFMFKPVRDDINGSHSASMRARLTQQLLHVSMSG